MIRNIKAYQKIRIYEPSARVNLDNSITHSQLTKNNKYKKGGVIAMIERLYYTADEIAQMVGVGRTSAYQIIRKMNEELSKQGYLVIKGKIPKEYFDEKYFGGSKIRR